MDRVPPGPTGEPLFGSSRRYARDPFRFVAGVERAYGDLARFELGPLETYLLADPAAIERVLVSEADRFRKPDFQNDALGDVLGEGMLLSEGTAWRRQRDLAGPAFGASRLAESSDRIVAHAENAVDDWDVGDVVDVESEMTHVALDVIVDLMLGVELPDPLVRTIRRQLQPLGRRFEPDPLRFALPDWVPLPGDTEFERALDALDRIIEEIVARRRDELRTEDDGLRIEGDGLRTEGDGLRAEGGESATDADEGTDYLSVLLRAEERGELPPGTIRDEVMTMLLAGHDTTALTLTYAWMLLSEHPEAERRLHAEVDAVVGDDRPGVEHVREFDYVERVVTESMRLYPPVYALFRTPTEPVELAGYAISESASLMLPQWAVHRSERFWDDPEAFDPDRWTPDRRSKRPQFAYFPFGGGPRHCIGKRLAMLEAQLVVAVVARRFRLEFLGETPIELLPSITAHPRRSMRMRIEPR